MNAPPTKSGRVLRALRDDIIAGRLAPGAPLDEVALAEAYEVSRTPVREALRELKSEGLLTPGSRRQLLVVDVSDEHRHELTTIRVALEGAAVADACQRAEPEDLDELRLMVIKQRRLAEADDVAGFLQQDEQFHAALAATARMPTLSRLLSQLGAFVRLTRLGEPTDRKHMLGLAREHDRLVDLLEARDADRLRAALTAHVSDTGPRE